MLGFVPGFAYMGRVDPSIAAPRHRVPRERVPAGSVGIAGLQTGVYPVESPGGWQLIGRTATVMFDAESRSRPACWPPATSCGSCRSGRSHDAGALHGRQAGPADHGAGPWPLRPSGVRCAGGRADGCVLASARESAGRQRRRRGHAGDHADRPGADRRGRHHDGDRRRAVRGDVRRSAGGDGRVVRAFSAGSASSSAASSQGARAYLAVAGGMQTRAGARQPRHAPGQPHGRLQRPRADAGDRMPIADESGAAAAPEVRRA